MEHAYNGETQSHQPQNQTEKIALKNIPAKRNYVRIGLISDQENNVCAEIQVLEKAVHEIAIFSSGCLFIKRFIQLEAGRNLIKLPSIGLKKGIHLLTVFFEDTSSSKTFSV
jgi:hypothetical protein